MSSADLGIFVGLRPTNSSIENLTLLQAALGVPNPVPRDELHCTLVDSERTMPGYKAWGDIWPSIHANTHNLEVWPWMDTRECLVLTLHSDDILFRYNRLCMLYDVPPAKHPYIPHITLSYGLEDFDRRLFAPSVLHNILPQISFVEEYSEPICGAVRDYITHHMRVKEHSV